MSKCARARIVPYLQKTQCLDSVDVERTNASLKYLCDDHSVLLGRIFDLEALSRVRQPLFIRVFGRQTLE
jgi:hypothetical protein